MLSLSEHSVVVILTVNRQFFLLCEHLGSGQPAEGELPLDLLGRRLALYSTNVLSRHVEDRVRSSTR